MKQKITHNQLVQLEGERFKLNLILEELAEVVKDFDNTEDDDDGETIT